MKHLFVPYEIAKIAKEKGFNEYCIGEYTKHAKTQAINLNYPKYEGLQGNWPEENEVDAPIYQQLIDWFKEEYNCFIEPETTMTDKFGNTNTVYRITVINPSLTGLKTSKRTGTEKTLNEAIKKAFELIP